MRTLSEVVKEAADKAQGGRGRWLVNVHVWDEFARYHRLRPEILMLLGQPVHLTDADVFEFRPRPLKARP